MTDSVDHMSGTVRKLPRSATILAVCRALPVTIFIMAKQKKPTAHARRAIAARAARVMAEDSVNDFGTAKRKAARQLGFAENEGLPSNEEVEVELRVYQQLYQNDEQRERLSELRSIAMEIMREFSVHRPHLTGTVWNGTAGRETGVQIDLFTDSAKAVGIKLLGQNLPYRVQERPHFNPALTRKVVVLEFDWHEVPVRLAVYDSDDLRGALIAEAAGIAARGDLAALEARIAAADSAAQVEHFLAAIR